jgi:hypothetical protein
MLASLFVAMFALAGAATYIALTRRVDARLGGVVALALWARLTPAAFNITVFSGGSELAAPADGATAILTATLALLMLVFVLGTAFDAIPGREETRFGSAEQPNQR